MSKNLEKAFAEFIGTFALVFMGCGSIMVTERFAVEGLPVPVVFGLVVAVMIYALAIFLGPTLTRQ